MARVSRQQLFFLHTLQVSFLEGMCGGFAYTMTKLSRVDSRSGCNSMLTCVSSYLSSKMGTIPTLYIKQ